MINKTKQIQEPELYLAKSILDRWATLVIPRIYGKSFDEDTVWFDNRDEDPTKHKWKVKARWQTQADKFQYKTIGYVENLCLWKPPFNCVPIEFEGTRAENEHWIRFTAEGCDRLGFDYCICDHQGKSSYLWIFNVEGLTTILQKKILVYLLIPPSSKVDFSNLGEKTLVPVIEHPHWKYMTPHKIISGTDPLQHKNKLPEVVTKLISLISACDIPKESPIAESSTSEIRKEKIKIILSNDTFIQKLLGGNITRYPSPSEARMACLVSLCGYGLNNFEIKWIMDRSKNLHWQEKFHLNDLEVGKARSVCQKRRTILA